MLELVRNPGRTTAANRATREEQQLRAEKPARHREAEVPRRVVRPAAVEITVELERIRGERLARPEAIPDLVSTGHRLRASRARKDALTWTVKVLE